MHKLVLILVGVIAVSDFVLSNCPTIISRSEWGARAPKSSRFLRANPPPYVVVHHSDGDSCTTIQSCKSRVKNIQNYHMNNKGWEDIGYNFLIGGDGNVYEGRGWGVHGSHVPKYNARSIGVCLTGNFMYTQPPQIQLDTLKELISCGQSKGKIAPVYHLIGHRQGSSTTCPGNMLFNEIKTWSSFDNSI